MIAVSEHRLSQVAVPAARLIFAGVFVMAFAFKVMGMESTATYIAQAGFPASHVLAVLAAGLEIALALAFLTGAFFREASLVAVIYVLFLGFAFHGPSHWTANQAEFGFFVDHFVFVAGLLFAAVHGPGRRFALDRYRLLVAKSA
ncbi:MAG TPA: DoxX family protein [Rhizomicrobium sp.]